MDNLFLRPLQIPTQLFPHVNCFPLVYDRPLQFNLPHDLHQTVPHFTLRKILVPLYLLSLLHKTLNQLVDKPLKGLLLLFVVFPLSPPELTQKLPHIQTILITIRYRSWGIQGGDSLEIVHPPGEGVLSIGRMLVLCLERKRAGAALNKVAKVVEQSFLIDFFVLKRDINFGKLIDQSDPRLRPVALPTLVQKSLRTLMHCR